MKLENMSEELDEFYDKLIAYSAKNCPSWLTPNSNFVGVIPGHNLDLLQISFDFKIDRTGLLLAETPEVLKDPQKPDLRLLGES